MKKNSLTLTPLSVEKFTLKKIWYKKKPNEKKKLSHPNTLVSWKIFIEKKNWWKKTNEKKSNDSKKPMKKKTKKPIKKIEWRDSPGRPYLWPRPAAPPSRQLPSQACPVWCPRTALCCLRKSRRGARLCRSPRHAGTPPALCCVLRDLKKKKN